MKTRIFRLAVAAFIGGMGAAGCAGSQDEPVASADQGVTAACPTYFADYAPIRTLVNQEVAKANSSGLPKSDPARRMQSLLRGLERQLGFADPDHAAATAQSFVFMNAADAAGAAGAAKAMKQIAQADARFTSIVGPLDTLAMELQSANLAPLAFDAAKWRCLSDSARLRAIDAHYNIELEEVALANAGLPNDAAVRSAAEKVAKDEANDWGDTILEGDYALDGDATAKWIDVLRFRGVAIGYRITVAAPAVITSEDGCEYDEAAEKWTGTCPKGTIQSTRVMDWDFKDLDTPHEPEFS